LIHVSSFLAKIIGGMNKYIFAYSEMLLFETNPQEYAFEEKTPENPAKIATPKEIRSIALQSAKERRVNAEQYLDTVEKRIKNGDLCFVIANGENTFSYAWIAFNNFYINEISMEIRLKLHEVFLCDLYTFIKYRRRHYLHQVLSGIFKYLHDTGCKRVIGTTNRSNYKMLGMIKKFGIKVKNSITFVSIKFLVFHKFLIREKHESEIEGILSDLRYRRPS
jgi:hypothetical protein